MKNMLAGRYQIVRSLGEGGMADVYLAVDTILNREVAIKILRGDLGSDPLTLLRFSREANAASKLNHLNVVQVYDVGEAEGKHFIVMEYIGGHTLKQLIQLRGPLHKEEAINIMKQLVSAVQCAHENNIIHRDIKPQNVLVKADGTLKITDFGIALAHNAVQLTQSDSVLGSAHYLAPETTRGEVATNQTDIYALGIVFYELLSGSVPFIADNPMQVAMKHLREDVPSIREFNPSLPQSVENIIIKATAKNRAMRYSNAQAMLADLNSCLAEEHANDQKLVLPQPAEQLSDKTVVFERNNQSEIPQSNKKLGAILVALGVLIVVGIIVITGITNQRMLNQPTPVPMVMNMSVDIAREELEEAGFIVNVDVIYENNNEVEKGLVIRTIPKADTKITKDQPITLVVSKGKNYTIENYVGQDFETVSKRLSEIGVEVIGEKMPSDQLAGTILSQLYLLEGDVIDPTSRNNKIKLTYAGPKEFVMIGVVGLPIAEAESRLVALGAKVVFVALPTEDMAEEEIESLQKGVVVSSNIERGSYYIQENDNVIELRYYE